jgi:hypothetical protein
MTPNYLYRAYNICGKVNPNLKFLELGTSTGVAFSSLTFNNKYTVDLKRPDLIQRHPNSFELSTDEFFATTELTDFDLIFIDANHDADQVLRDYNSSVSKLREGGVIVLHDCYPPTEEYCDPRFCSDSYKILEALARTGQEVTFAKEDFGVTLVKSPKQLDWRHVNRSLSYTSFIDKMEYRFKNTEVEYHDLLFDLIENINTI